MIRKFLLKQIKKQMNSTPVGKQVVETIWGKDHSLSASFGKPSALISPHGNGFCIDGKNFLSIEKSRENCLIVGPSGRGKTQVTAIPTILNSKGKYSLIINDPSRELSSTIPYLQSVGYKCNILDFGNKKLYFNPLDSCNNRSQIRKVAKTLMSSITKEKEDFFTLSAEDCIALFIEYLKESEPYEFQNLANLYRLILELHADNNVVSNLFATKSSPEVFRKYRALIANSPNTLASILATTLANLSFVGDDPVLCDITSKTTIAFEEFRIRPHALYVHVPVSDSKHYSPIVSLFMQNFFMFALSKIPQSEQELDIFMIMDEFSLLKIENYSEIISNSRKYRIPQFLIIQTESLLHHTYGDSASKNIMGNCGVRTYFGGLQEESFQLERILGVYEYKESGYTKQRPLMTSSEIREMSNEALILPSGQKPLKVPITPAYKQPELVRKLNLRSQNPLPVENFTVSYIDLTPFR